MYISPCLSALPPAHSMAVAAGAEHTVAVVEDGSVFTTGSGKTGQLGTGDNVTRLAPMRMGGLPPSVGPVRQVAAGNFHTGIVTEAGDLFICGAGDLGRLGLGDEEDRATPTLVGRALFDGEAVLMVACAQQHTVVLTGGGGVYTFGRGNLGRLGHGNTWEQLAPRRVPAAAFRPNGSAEEHSNRIVMVAAGGEHTVALSEAGHVFTWGCGFFGQLGHNNNVNELAPRQIAGGAFMGEKVVFVAAGENHTAAVTSEGQLYTWGKGSLGELGHGDANHKLAPTLVWSQTGSAFGAPEDRAVVMAACGNKHTLVVTRDGGLWACGEGRDGQLGLNDRLARYTFERVGATGTRFVAAAAGYSHSAAVTEDGALWTWGRGDDGELGHGDTENRLVPTKVVAAGLEGKRIGRCRLLPTTHALALVLGTHGRLNAASPVRTLAGEPGLLTMIASAANRWVGGAAGECEGLVRLLGGVSADRRRRYVQTTHASYTWLPQKSNATFE